jgi:crotonobetainyl-CoA:carnitine CoA-transferase CaiB-like acyl-CoA transferase
VLDLSSLWAGPLTAHLLWLAGAEVIKVENRARPDAMRNGDATFYALLNQGKASVALDFERDKSALLSLIKTSDIVIEAARPRAFIQFGIDAAELVRTTPGLVWITITGHGAEGEATNWVGFGDDCGVAAGLSAELRAASGCTGFVGDAIADPLTGISAALTAWEGWTNHSSARYGLTMTHVVAGAISVSREMDEAGFASHLKAWSSSVGQPFPRVTRRHIGQLPAFGENTREYVTEIAPC